MPTRIPYAVANYEEIIADNYHFVDKTRFINQLELYKIPVFLRPRRFGKSLWCSILECYYDIHRKDRFEELFGKTTIGKDPTPSHNSLMVMRFNFSIVLPERGVEKQEQRFDEVCANAIGGFCVDYADFLGAGFNFNQPQSATTMLNAVLQRVHNTKAPPVMIIIDEYDNFTNQLLTSRQDQLYQKITTGDSFLRSFYKAIKAGVEARTVARVFVTGVLPVTMDDLTSGFNIGQIITLEDNTVDMMGFDQQELNTYLDGIFEEHGWGADLRKRVQEDLRIHYNGYRFLPAGKGLYNSTICNFYLNKLVIGEGKLPTDYQDINLKVDVNWLKRLAGSEIATEVVDRLLNEGSIPVDFGQFKSQFNREKFVQPEFFPMSLFFLGLLSFKDEYSLGFPNLSVKMLFMEYYNDLMSIAVSSGYTEMCRAFLKDHDFSALFAGYWDRYVGQIPAQAFDKINENFFRISFYEICTRYLSRYLHFAIEVNRPTGRSDFEALGRPGTAFEGKAWVLEFKHFKTKDLEEIKGWIEPRAGDVEQVNSYANSVTGTWPEYSVKRGVVYTISSKGFRFFGTDLQSGSTVPKYQEDKIF